MKKHLILYCFLAFICSLPKPGKAVDLILSDSFPSLYLTDTVVCIQSDFEVDIRSCRFRAVQGFQFTLSWPEELLLADTAIEFITPQIAANVAVNLQPERGRMEVQWFGNQIFLPDSSTMFRLRFKAVGGNADRADFTFPNAPTPLEVIITEGNIPTKADARTTGASVLMNGPVVLDSLIIPATAGQSDGSIELTVPDSAQYLFLWSTADTQKDQRNLLPGKYEVTIIDDQDCSLILCFEVDTRTAIDELSSLTEFTYAPNPVEDVLHLQLSFNQTVNGQISIYDVSGKLVFMEQFVSSALQKKIMTHQWPPGTYYLQLLDGTGQSTQVKIIKL